MIYIIVVIFQKVFSLYLMRVALARLLPESKKQMTNLSP